MDLWQNLLAHPVFCTLHEEGKVQIVHQNDWEDLSVAYSRFL